MNGFTDLKDIRFPDTKANILLRGGIISRENLMNIKDSTIMMRNVHFGIAKRINDVTSLEVKYLDEWRPVMCGDTDKLQSIYALTPSDEDVKKVEFRTFEEKVEIKPAQRIEHIDEETVKIVKDMIENPIGPSILGDNFPPHSDDEEETHEKEDDTAEEVEESSEDEATEEVEVADYTSETPSGHSPEDDYDADEHSEDEEKPEEGPSEEKGTETNSAEVFVTGMTVGDVIEGTGIGTITGVSTIATDSAEVSVEPNAFDASKVEATTSTASTNINSHGNARRQVNINTHGKHRRR